MNSGDLQYASGDVAIAGNLFVAGTVISSNTPAPGGGVTSVTAGAPPVAGGPTLKCDPTTGAVVVTYAATSLGNTANSGVPVNSMYTPDTAVFPAVGAAPLSGNILVTGGQTLLNGTLPRGAIVCSTKSGTTLTGAPTNVAGTLEITNVGIGGIVADSKSFTGTAASSLSSAAPGTVSFTSPYPGMTVRSSYLDGAVGSGIVEVSNVGVNSLAIKNSMAEPLVGDVLVSSGNGVSLSYANTPGTTTYPSGLWNFVTPYSHGEHACQEISLNNFVWSLCLTANVNQPPNFNTPEFWEPVAYWTPQLPYVGAGVFAVYLSSGIPYLYRSLQQATGIIPTNTAYWAIDGTPGIPSTSTQVIEISNSGVLSATAGTGIGVSGGAGDGTGAVTISNTGVLSVQSSSPPAGGGDPVSGETLIGPVVMSASDGSGIGILTSTVGPFKVCAFANTGVRSAVASTGIDVGSTGAGGTGAVTITNTGVTKAINGAGITVTTAGGTGTGEVTIINSGVLSVVPNSVDYTLRGISVAGTQAVTTIGYSQPYRNDLRTTQYVAPVTGFGTGVGSMAQPWMPTNTLSGIFMSIDFGPWILLDRLLYINQNGFSKVTGYISTYGNFVLYTGRAVSPDVAPAHIDDYSCLTLTDSIQREAYCGSIQMVRLATYDAGPPAAYNIYGAGFLISPEFISPATTYSASFVLDI